MGEEGSDEIDCTLAHPIERSTRSGIETVSLRLSLTSGMLQLDNGARGVGAGNQDYED